MSRAINTKATPAEMTKLCQDHKATITAMEVLRSGGTRVVLTTGHDAARIVKLLKAKVIDGPVVRHPLSMRTG